MSKTTKKKTKKTKAEFYCGPKTPVPSGKERGTAGYCASKNQVRFYGVKKIDKDILKTHEKKPKNTDVVTEGMKYRKLVEKRKLMVKKFEVAKIIADNENETPGRRRAAEKKIADLKAQNKKIRAKMNQQLAIVRKLEKAEDIAGQVAKAKAADKAKKKKSKKSTKSKKSKKGGAQKSRNSGSKTNKKTTKPKKK